MRRLPIPGKVVGVQPFGNFRGCLYGDFANVVGVAIVKRRRGDEGDSGLSKRTDERCKRNFIKVRPRVRNLKALGFVVRTCAGHVLNGLTHHVQ